MYEISTGRPRRYISRESSPSTERIMNGSGPGNAGAPRILPRSVSLDRSSAHGLSPPWSAPHNAATLPRSRTISESQQQQQQKPLPTTPSATPCTRNFEWLAKPNSTNIWNPQNYGSLRRRHNIYVPIRVVCTVDRMHL